MGGSGNWSAADGNDQKENIKYWGKKNQNDRDFLSLAN